MARGLQWAQEPGVLVIFPGDLCVSHTGEPAGQAIPGLLPWAPMQGQGVAPSKRSQGKASPKGHWPQPQHPPRKKPPNEPAYTHSLGLSAAAAAFLRRPRVHRLQEALCSLSPYLATRLVMDGTELLRFPWWAQGHIFPSLASLPLALAGPLPRRDAPRLDTRSNVGR